MAAGQVTMTIGGPDGRWLKRQAETCRVKPADLVRRMIAAERAKPELAPYLQPVPKLDEMSFST
jgi:hypothetical protein